MSAPVTVTRRGWLVLDGIVIVMAAVALVLLWQLWRHQDRIDDINARAAWPGDVIGETTTVGE